MRQYEIDELVARALNESPREIRRRGFTIADDPDVNFDPEPGPQVYDWDQLKAVPISVICF
jgi:hypothetical protein